ncbi:GntR family transcriptional regulator [Streptomyces sp. NPDC058653]|uniref:GntR family transcriptional regulator n=1 Tax=Streptomyces sp. NPDC058653 TaxID=3346576 RepID=UPI003653DDE3
MTDDQPSAEPTALYRLYDADGNLLYVGITNNPKVRFGNHGRSKPWWPEVELKQIVWLDSLQEAEEAERLAIASEGPRHNISNNALKIAGLKRSGKRVSYKDIANDLRAAILDGQFAPGSRLPGINQLRREYSAAGSTVRQAFASLKTENLISSRKGAGMFVRDLDGNRTILIAVDQPQQAAELLANYMSPSDLRTLAEALALKVKP